METASKVIQFTHPRQPPGLRGKEPMQMQPSLSRESSPTEVLSLTRERPEVQVWPGHGGSKQLCCRADMGACALRAPRKRAAPASKRQSLKGHQH